MLVKLESRNEERTELVVVNGGNDGALNLTRDIIPTWVGRVV